MDSTDTSTTVVVSNDAVVITGLQVEVVTSALRLLGTGGRLSGHVTTYYSAAADTVLALIEESEREPEGCAHESVRQVDEHDVQCLECGLVSA